jgi:hypothetical protein
LEIVPAISSERPKGCEWNPFQGVKITAYRSEEVDKLVTELEAKISEQEVEISNLTTALLKAQRFE